LIEKTTVSKEFIEQDMQEKINRNGKNTSPKNSGAIDIS